MAADLHKGHKYIQKDLVKELSDITGFNKEDINVIISNLGYALSNLLRRNPGTYLNIWNLGSFYAYRNKDKMAIDLNDPEHKVRLIKCNPTIKFRASKTFRKGILEPLTYVSVRSIEEDNK